MSKGSSQRPTDKQKYDDQYEAIFGKKNKEQSVPNRKEPTK